MLDPRGGSIYLLPDREGACRSPDLCDSNRFGTIPAMVRSGRNGHGRCHTPWQAVEQRRRHERGKGHPPPARRPQWKGRFGGRVVMWADSPRVVMAVFPSGFSWWCGGGRTRMSAMGNMKSPARRKVMRPRRAFVSVNRHPRRFPRNAPVTAAPYNVKRTVDPRDLGGEAIVDVYHPAPVRSRRGGQGEGSPCAERGRDGVLQRFGAPLFLPEHEWCGERARRRSGRRRHPDGDGVIGPSGVPLFFPCAKPPDRITC